ncbi:hypothetical protein PIB30_086220 [Stylosanthes scabra]|uniref:Uncharacterized protein n=1 Tax=Stylosanthes scabra TaxID=79078 RepID=A0ABU6URW1_9FABA|nr:hypothetical protein [Stylosanthes scabra]
MAKKKSCQNVRNPRVLSPVERELYCWVDAEVFTQSSALASEHLPELRREMRLTQDLASERDFVLEVAGPSDRLPFRALEDRTHFLWVYVELFTRLGVRLPFTDFQREFHAPPPRNGFLSFRAYQGRRLFDAFEESIQEFKWHYFKVLPLPGTCPFWVDDEGKPFPWVYWNSGARECRITGLDPLETLAFDFLQSLPVGLGKKSNFRCRWILDHSDAEVGAFLDSLLTDMEKQSRFDRLKQKMAEVAGMGLRSVLPHVRTPSTTSGASASGQAVPAPAPVASTAPVPPPAAAKKRGSSKDPAGKPFSVEGEEGAKEDPSADLKNKGRKRKAPEASAEEAALGADSSWEHKVSPINRAFPDDYNFRAALDAGLTNGPTREILGPLVPEQLLGTAQHLACQLTACLQVGIEKAFAAKVQMEKELVSLKDQVDVLTVERDSSWEHKSAPSIALSWMTTTSGRLWMLALPMVLPRRFLAPWCRSNFSGQPNTLLANSPLAFRYGCSCFGIEKAFAAKVQMEKELVSLKDQVDVLTVERDSSWEHKVSLINRAFPDDYNFRVALDAGLTNGPTREILGPLVPEQLLGTAQHLACQLTACLQIEKELVSLKDQVDVLTVERDSALAAPLLNAKIKSLTQELAVSEGERLSALARMAEVEEETKVQAVQLESCLSALEKEKKEAEGLAKSLREKLTTLDGVEAATAHWRDE